jgi:ATP-dependent protease HslVU (ClpYQ) peptidase subunit
VTCIAVVRGLDGHVWMGADSAGVRDSTRYAVAEKSGKIVNLGNGVWLGVAGVLSAATYLRGSFRVSVPFEPTMDALEWLVDHLCPAMRERYEAHGAWNTSTFDDGSLRGSEAHIIAVVGGRVFELSQTLVPTESAGDYHAVGCGEDVALGALGMVMESAPHYSPSYMLHAALNLSALHKDGISAPFVIVDCSASHPTGARPCDTHAGSARSTPPASKTAEAE